MRKSRIALLVFLSLALLYFLAILHRVGIAVIAYDLIAEFNTDASLLGLMSSAYFFPYAVAQIPVGIMLDRIGIRKTVSITATIACIGSFIFATGSDLLGLSIGRALVGFGVGGFYVSSLKAVAVWFDPRKFATLGGLITSIGNIGGIVATSPLALLTMYIGWRCSFLSIFAMMVAATAIAWFAIKEDPNPSFKSTSSIAYDLKKVFTNRDFLKILPIPFFVYGLFISFQGLWGGPFLMDVYRMDKATSGFYLMFIGIGFTLAGPIAGFISDKVIRRRKPVLLMGQLMCFTFWMALALYGSQLGPAVTILAMFLLGFGFGFVNIYMTIAKELFETNICGTALACFNTSNFIGAGFFQSFMGIVLDSIYGGARTFPAYQSIFIMAVACIVATIFLTLISKETINLNVPYGT